MGGFIQTSKPFDTFGKKAEQYLASRFPAMVDGNIRNIHIGRNKDAAAGDRSGYRITGASAQTRGNYLETPEKILPVSAIANKEDAGRSTFKTRVSDSARAYIAEEMQRLQESGVTGEAAEKRIKDSLDVIGYFDTKENMYVAEPVQRRVKDSLLSGMAVPYWNVSYVNRVFKQPFIQGIARNLVDVIGVPNIWADALVMFAETFEGMARVSGVAKSNAEHNDSAPVRNRFEQLVSEFVNVVIDYETGFDESLVGAQEGNFLTSMGIGDRERYARLMLEQLTNAMWLFGASEAGFEGLSQLATTDTYSGTTLQAIWEGSSATKGALAVTALMTMLGDMQESLSFMAASFRINVSPTAYKVLKWVMMSDVYNSNNPLSVIKNSFGDSEMIVSNGFGTGVGDFVIVSDPFCAPQTPWNANDSDLMFITIPSVKSALEPMSSLVVAPVAIENFVLPAYPQRDGLQRTMMRRVGSIIAPVTGTIKIVRGFGVQ
jgi:hypothetical protein